MCVAICAGCQSWRCGKQINAGFAWVMISAAFSVMLLQSLGLDLRRFGSSLVPCGHGKGSSATKPKMLHAAWNSRQRFPRSEGSLPRVTGTANVVKPASRISRRANVAHIDSSSGWGAKINNAGLLELMQRHGFRFLGCGTLMLRKAIIWACIFRINCRNCSCMPGVCGILTPVATRSVTQRPLRVWVQSKRFWLWMLLKTHTSSPCRLGEFYLFHLLLALVCGQHKAQCMLPSNPHTFCKKDTNLGNGTLVAAEVVVLEEAWSYRL